ncbi:type II toxin-antitoxin system RelE/ParE family toxin [Xanthobacter variabilis]|uniref:type II toxin-antitoxin system RelE/ParE family toxin n=1 Tax=Xanthobacter variabilis TaxID=3119932 RepID=UPI00374EC98B
MSGTRLLAPRAPADLESIRHHAPASWGEGPAERIVREMADTRADIAAGLDVGRQADAVRDGDFRYPLGDHVAFYRRRLEVLLVVLRIVARCMDAGRGM